MKKERTATTPIQQCTTENPSTENEMSFLKNSEIKPVEFNMAMNEFLFTMAQSAKLLILTLKQSKRTKREPEDIIENNFESFFKKNQGAYHRPDSDSAYVFAKLFRVNFSDPDFLTLQSDKWEPKEYDKFNRFIQRDKQVLFSGMYTEDIKSSFFTAILSNSYFFTQQYEFVKQYIDHIDTGIPYSFYESIEVDLETIKELLSSLAPDIEKLEWSEMLSKIYAESKPLFEKFKADEKLKVRDRIFFLEMLLSLYERDFSKKKISKAAQHRLIATLMDRSEDNITDAIKELKKDTKTRMVKRFEAVVGSDPTAEVLKPVLKGMGKMKAKEMRLSNMKKK